jgi:hypothetical protein
VMVLVLVMVVGVVVPAVAQAVAQAVTAGIHTPVPAMAVGAQVEVLVRFKPFLLPELFYLAESVRLLSVGCAGAEPYRMCCHGAGLTVAIRYWTTGFCLGHQPVSKAL